jgi:hypothetical protein
MARTLRGGDTPPPIDGDIYIFQPIDGYSVSWKLQASLTQ